MEEKQKSKECIFLIVILIIVIMGLIGYIVYDKNSYNQNFSNDTIMKTDNEISDKNIDTETTNNLYNKYLNNLKTNITKNYDNFNNNYEYVENLETGLEYSLKIEKNGDLNLSFYNEDLKQKYNNYKLSGDVLTMFLIQVGQSGFYNVYFLKNDGTIFSQCIDCLALEDVALKKENYKNIVNIIQGGFDMEYSGVDGPIFIDIEGNIYTN